MKILVTGGAGYIGSTTVSHLLASGHEVTVYDDLSHGHLEAIPRDADFIQASIADHEKLNQAMSVGVEAVVHFAGLIEAGESMKKPGVYFHANVSASTTLIETAILYGVKNFVFSSSAAVYASQDEPLCEDSPIGPASVYGQTKRMVEEILAWYHRLYGLKCCSLRYFNAAGASKIDGLLRGEDHRPETHLVPLVLQVALGKREQISIFGNDYPTRDGTNIRDYIHIDDLALAHVLALESLKDEREAFWVYNLGNGKGYSNLEVVETARKITGHAIPATMAARRAGDAAYLVASSDRIRQRLGWIPRYPQLETIISSAWEWHRANPDGYTDKLENA